MPAMIDAQCPKCGKRFGWSGRMADQPPCPRCGHRAPQAELEAADKEMEDFKRLLATRPNASVCRKQRVAAGLTLRQAAKVLGLTPPQLADYEHGRAEIPEATKDAMAKTYGGDPT